MSPLRVLAPAKVNLSLEVLGRRADGYHEVRTVIQAVDVCDELELREAGALSLKVEPEGSAPMEGNLVLLAAERFLASDPARLDRVFAAAYRALFEESLEIKKQLGDRWGMANSLSNLGMVAYNQDDYPAARALFEESLTLRREVGDRSHQRRRGQPTDDRAEEQHRQGDKG